MATSVEGKITRGHWMALAAALMGWLFDGLEMGVFSLVARPALQDLLTTDAGVPGDTDVGFWIGVVVALFLVGAATGGVVFGWLGDRIGRVRAMMLSVATYALFTGACGLAAEAWQIALLRFIASLGMGGEWALGVSLVMEIWPNRSRAFLAGLIGAAANVGYLLIAFVGLGLAEWLPEVHETLASVFSESTADWLAGHGGWRLLMLSGTLPAMLTFFIRLFVPESEKWEHEKDKGTVSHWATRDLLGVLVGAAGPALVIFVWAVENPLWLQIVGTLAGVAIATAGYSYPVIRFLQRDAAVAGSGSWAPTWQRMLLAACLSGVPLVATWAAVQWAPSWADKLTEQSADDVRKTAKSMTQIWSSIGAILGTILAALLGDFLGRKASYAALCIASFLSIQLLFGLNDSYGNFFLFCVFVAGLCTASFYGWLPLYLPELFRTRVRATGQGFGFNFGRILAAVGALQTGNLIREVFENDYATACSTMGSVYLIGVVLIFFAPETRGKPLPD